MPLVFRAAPVAHVHGSDFSLPSAGSHLLVLTPGLADLALHCSLAFPIYDATWEQLLLSAPVQGWVQCSGELLREAHHLPSSNPTSGTNAFIVSEGQSDTTGTEIIASNGIFESKLRQESWKLFF